MVKSRQRPPGASVTADDVAQKAGVSRWTVTRAFKRGASISKARREIVLKAAEELDYAPDLLASGLASHRSGLLALLMDDFENPHKLLMLQHLTEALQANGIAAILINVNAELTPATALMNASQRRVDATVLIGTSFSEDILASAAVARRSQLLIVFARDTALEDSVSISCDNDFAIREMTRYALDLGHRRPLFIAGPITVSTPLRRRDAFVNAMEEAGCPTPEVIHVEHYSQGETRQAVAAALQRISPPPDLIFCENDVMALGAVDAVRAAGLNVPEDISVMGFDNIPLAESPAYDLTTYEQPLNEMVQRLIEVVHGEWPEDRRHLIRGRLVTRGSVAAKSLFRTEPAAG
jgi:LacI family transcriptional regulator, galactose operon repressor